MKNMDFDVAGLRRSVGFSQKTFAILFGFPLGSLKNWEQGVRKNISGGVLAYLEMIKFDPKGMETIALTKLSENVESCLGTLNPEQVEKRFSDYLSVVKVFSLDLYFSSLVNFYVSHRGLISDEAWVRLGFKPGLEEKFKEQIDGEFS